MIYEIIQNIQLTILQRVRLIRHLYIGAFNINWNSIAPSNIYIVCRLEWGWINQ